MAEFQTSNQTMLRMVLMGENVRGELQPISLDPSTGGLSTSDSNSTSGASGFSGSSGVSGFSGASGFSGTYSGYSGFSGISGFSGASGFSGKSGTSGYSGVSGYSGSSGKSGYSGFNAGSTQRISGDQTFTSNTTFADIGLSVTLSAGKHYKLRGVLFINNVTSGAGGVKIQATGTASYIDLRYILTIFDVTTKAVVANSILNATGTAVSVSTISTGDNIIYLEGFATDNNPGTFKLQGAQGTSSADSTVFKRGSWLCAEEVP